MQILTSLAVTHEKYTVGRTPSHASKSISMTPCYYAHKWNRTKSSTSLKDIVENKPQVKEQKEYSRRVLRLFSVTFALRNQTVQCNIISSVVPK